jgi:hypothetical protein
MMLGARSERGAEIQLSSRRVSVRRLEDQPFFACITHKSLLGIGRLWRLDVTVSLNSIAGIGSSLAAARLNAIQSSLRRSGSVSTAIR